MGSSCGTPESAEVQISSKRKTRTLDLSHFAYSQGSGMRAALQKSHRKSSEHPKNEGTLPIFTSEGIKRPMHPFNIQSEHESSSQPLKRQKRSYAAPETYAHLPGLQDWLKDGLDGNVFSFHAISYLTQILGIQ